MSIFAAKKMHRFLTIQQAALTYKKASVRTLRSWLNTLTDEQKKYVKSDGKRLLVSTEILDQYFLKTDSTDSSTDRPTQKKQQTSKRTTDQQPADTDTSAGTIDTNTGTNTGTGTTDQLALITQLQNENTHLQNANTQLIDRLKESHYIIASLTKQLPALDQTQQADRTPAPTDSTGVPFIWFVVGLVFGLVAIGLAVVIYK